MLEPECYALPHFLTGSRGGFSGLVDAGIGTLATVREVFLHPARVSRNCDIGGALRACEGGHVLGRGEDDH